MDKLQLILHTPPPSCENTAVVKTSRGVVSLTFGTMELAVLTGGGGGAWLPYMTAPPPPIPALWAQLGTKGGWVWPGGGGHGLPTSQAFKNMENESSQQHHT